ncbi:MAG: hypothetical protein PUC82_04135 [bacterium]|nr:hypothetical protein [bacterium]
MKNQERKLTLKNYLILLLVFAITIILTLYLCKCYTVYRESIKEIPVIRGTLSEITSEELDHYIQENPNCTVYICTASNPNCRNFEEDFIKLIKKKSLQESIVYLNLSNANQEEFINSFNDEYNYKIKLTANYPAIIMFEDAKISSILQESEDTLTIIKAKQFIELNKIGE